MKQTNVPDGWKEVKLGDIAEISQGYTFKPEYQGFPNEKWNYFKVADIGLLTNHKYLYHAINTIPDKTLSVMKRALFKKGSIVFPRVGAALKNNNKKILSCDSLIDDNTLALTVTDITTDSEFIYYVFETKDLSTFCNDGTVPVINAGNVLKQGILLPPLAEQKEIAGTLSVWDNMVEKMELLIAKKEEVFKFVQQQLITLPSEKENWTKVKIKDVIKLITPPYKIEKDEYQLNGKYPIIDQSKADIDGWTDNAEYVVNEGMPLVIFGDHTCKVKIVDVPFAQGADGIKIMSISPLLNPFYFYHYLLANPIAAEGYMRHFSILTDKDLFYPSYERQKEIAEILNCYQNEINIMEELIAQYKLQKQGLMQKLLTGQWRIK